MCQISSDIDFRIPDSDLAIHDTTSDSVVFKRTNVVKPFKDYTNPTVSTATTLESHHVADTCSLDSSGSFGVTQKAKSHGCVPSSTTTGYTFVSLTAVTLGIPSFTRSCETLGDGPFNSSEDDYIAIASLFHRSKQPLPDPLVPTKPTAQRISEGKTRAL